MALINSNDKLIQDFSEVFFNLEKVFDSHSSTRVCGEECGQVRGSPPVALNSETVGKLDENPRGFVQMCEEEESLKNNEYAQMVLQYFPVIIGVGKALMPYLEKGSPALFPVLRNVGIIGIGIACFAELIVLKQIIEKDCNSGGAEAKVLLDDTLDYTTIRIQDNRQRFKEIEELILKAKLEDFDGSSKKRSPLLITLEEKIRVCKIDISECIQKTDELYQKIESTIDAVTKKLVTSAVAAGVFGTLAVLGSAAAIVATGGLAIVAGVAAGVTGVATGGLSYRAKLCGDLKSDFVGMKARCESLLKDVKRMENRIKLHVKELLDKNIDVGISLADFD